MGNQDGSIDSQQFSGPEQSVKLRCCVSRTEWAEIELNLTEMTKGGYGWDDIDLEDPDDIKEALWEIGVRDLMYSGDFIRVLDSDADEEIEIYSERK